MEEENMIKKNTPTLKQTSTLKKKTPLEKAPTLK
jgi:hypothetical protein